MGGASGSAATSPSPTVVRPAAINCPGANDVFAPDGGAMGCFNPTGEHLFVCDTAADGHHPEVDYSINGGTWTGAAYDLGAGNCEDVNLDIAESGSISYLACTVEGTTALSCSGYITRSANG